MIIFTPYITPRLAFIGRFAGELIDGSAFVLTDSQAEYVVHAGPRINYSANRIMEEELLIVPHGLLFESGIREQEIVMTTVGTNRDMIITSTGGKQEMPCFFTTPGDLPFDVLSAAFFLLSRYEEWLGTRPDRYGRYDHRLSLAFREGFLDRPLVNEWMRLLKHRLAAVFPGYVFKPAEKFVFRPTYDIDIAWSYLHKGFKRTFGGLVRSVLAARFSETLARLRVLRGRQRDPFESYEWLNQLHIAYGIEPVYFFLLAARKGRYDKNNDPRSSAMMQLVKHHAKRYVLGIHPSYRSGDNPGLMERELGLLKSASSEDVTRSRQHYIRFIVPDTFRALIAAGIKEDYSMGYGSINGFRASVATPYNWFDLQANRETDLQLFPFCFMDANSFYEQGFNASEALEEIKQFYVRVKDVNGTFISIWHNHFLGTDPKFAAWKESYGEFIAWVKEPGLGSRFPE